MTGAGRYREMIYYGNKKAPSLISGYKMKHLLSIQELCRKDSV